MQKSIIIADSSCLILLEKLGMLNILHQLFGIITITGNVADEFNKDIPEWINIIDPKNEISVLVLEAYVDRGEASSIALALEIPHSLLIIDDLKGRKVASRFGINITGTFGIMVSAKEKSIIPCIKPVLDKIRQTNFRFSKHLEMEILRLACE